MGITLAAIIMIAMPAATTIAEDDVIPVKAQTADVQVQTVALQNAPAAPAAPALAQSKITTPAAVTAKAAAPAPKYKLKASADGKSHVNLKWSKVKSAKGYTIYRSSKSKKYGKKLGNISKNEKRIWQDNSAEIGKAYYYTVKAWKKVDGKKVTLAIIKSKKVKNKLDIEKTMTFKTYAYSGGGTTASGKAARVGLVAVDPNVIPLGTWLYIEDYGLCQAADTGGNIKGNKIDLYMNSHGECIQWGVRSKTVHILD
jgi:3D (Asp-Asp-Asp) domain-containing protein